MSAKTVAVVIAEVAVAVAANLAFDKYVTKPVISKAFTPIRAKVSGK